jgi:hypothetical protein
MATGPIVPDNVKTGIAYLCNSDSNRSVMCWYDNASTSVDGVTLPQAADPVGPTNGFVTWEGHDVAGIIMSSNDPTDVRSPLPFKTVSFGIARVDFPSFCQRYCSGGVT